MSLICRVLSHLSDISTSALTSEERPLNVSSHIVKICCFCHLCGLVTLNYTVYLSPLHEYHHNYLHSYRLDWNRFLRVIVLSHFIDYCTVIVTIWINENYTPIAILLLFYIPAQVQCYRGKRGLREGKWEER